MQALTTQQQNEFNDYWKQRPNETGEHYSQWFAARFSLKVNITARKDGKGAPIFPAISMAAPIPPPPPKEVSPAPRASPVPRSTRSNLKRPMEPPGADPSSDSASPPPQPKVTRNYAKKQRLDISAANNMAVAAPSSTPSATASTRATTSPVPAPTSTASTNVPTAPTPAPAAPIASMPTPAPTPTPVNSKFSPTMPPAPTLAGKKLENGHPVTASPSVPATVASDSNNTTNGSNSTNSSNNANNVNHAANSNMSAADLEALRSFEWRRRDLHAQDRKINSAVTLQENERQRNCIGSIEAFRAEEVTLEVNSINRRIKRAEEFMKNLAVSEEAKRTKIAEEENQRRQESAERWEEYQRDLIVWVGQKLDDANAEAKEMRRSRDTEVAGRMEEQRTWKAEKEKLQGENSALKTENGSLKEVNKTLEAELEKERKHGSSKVVELQEEVKRLNEKLAAAAEMEKVIEGVAAREARRERWEEEERRRSGILKKQLEKFGGGVLAD
ncbi:hypothetical protein BDD12DRAFT_492946 [Trichophaea hybrida]|nr:hypothetical protein BDD12DRAFT_492946 [Trichophaea hybrida]